MSSTTVETRFAPRWLHAWSVLTAAATVALLALGAVVTTFQVGMADPIWPTLPWHLALIDWTEPNPGFVIEHTHRLAGYLIGCCVIVLTVGLLASARRSWLKWLGVAALAGVIALGLRRWSLALTALVFLQLIWGALVRHTNGTLAQRLHVLTAFAVVAVAVW